MSTLGAGVDVPDVMLVVQTRRRDKVAKPVIQMEANCQQAGNRSIIFLVQCILPAINEVRARSRAGGPSVRNVSIGDGETEGIQYPFSALLFMLPYL